MSARFLTLLTALGTLATAFVTYRTARDTHEQAQLLKRQVEFNSIETRPFLRPRPSVENDTKWSVRLNVVNVGKIPARVLAYDMLIQLGSERILPTGGTWNTEDVLYPDQPGLGVYQILPNVKATAFTSGLEPLVVAGCVIYGSLDAADTRRWKVSIADHFESTENLPTRIFADEVSVSPETERCDASVVRDQWLRRIKKYPN